MRTKDYLLGKKYGEQEAYRSILKSLKTADQFADGWVNKERRLTSRVEYYDAFIERLKQRAAANEPSPDVKAEEDYQRQLKLSQKLAQHKLAKREAALNARELEIIRVTSQPIFKLLSRLWR